MSRRYADHITVDHPGPIAAFDDSAPVRFRWRGRSYLVLNVLQHWVEIGPWWLDPDTTREEEYHFWRVEAAMGRGAAAGRGRRTAGQYDLCRHRSTGRWFLARAFD